ncbi:MAG TPA: TylF/MycF/NovP-related O-methyltransferase [Steroidobacteraceae bacterium]|jgi:O-methyltransferase|nr:TylF/MycF/NovP-related O-methyltransferase [Steroidobacteraceae bacterium]
MNPGRFVNSLLAAIDLKIVAANPSQQRFPVELQDSDQRMFRYVRENKLSTSSDERLFATIMACRYVVERTIAGDFVECGVWRGGNSLLAADVFRSLASGRRVWLYDTFAGMTEPTAADVNFRGEAADVNFRLSRRTDHNDWCYAPLEEVRTHFANAGLLTEQVRFIKGDVAQTLSAAGELPQTIAVLRLDTDWYESTKTELEALYPRLVPGGVLIIDDYGHWGGARKAVDEYFAARERPFLQYIDPTARIGVKRS